MLGKLMKYEVKATSRIFLLIYSAVLFLAAINRIFYSFGGLYDGTMQYNTIYNVLTGLFTTMYVIMLIGLFFAVMIIVIQRFYKNLFGDEGYLMNTLPVTAMEHIVSKSLVSALWFIGSLVVTAISLLIMFSHPAVFDGMSEAITEINDAMRYADFSLTPFVIEFVVIMLLACFGYALPYYACISIGQLWKKHRVLGGFLAYFAISTISQTVMSFAIGIASVPVFNNSWNDTPSVVSYVHTIMIVSIVFTILTYIAYFFISKYVLERKLDLE